MMFGVKQHKEDNMINNDTWRWNTLPNFGYITEKLPENLFRKIKEECQIAEQTRYNLTNNKKDQMISGLTGDGIPLHYYLKDCKQELNEYTMHLFQTYDNFFKYSSHLKYANKHMNLINTPPWINIQERGEYIPAHNHDGILAYVIWVKIPYDVKEEMKNGGTSSTFSFLYNNILGGVMQQSIEVSKEYEGTIMMFPSSLTHQVYPFYTSDDIRISVSGMISFDVDKPMPSDKQLEMYS